MWSVIQFSITGIVLNHNLWGSVGYIGGGGGGGGSCDRWVIPTYDLVIHHGYDDTEDDDDKSWYDYNDMIARSHPTNIIQHGLDDTKDDNDNSSDDEDKSWYDYNDMICDPNLWLGYSS